jgi:hypothetical protein
MKFFNYEIAAITEALYTGIENLENTRRAWAYSLYYAILNSLMVKIDPPEWEEAHKQWNIDHLYRGALSSRKKQEKPPVFEIRKVTKKENALVVNGQLSSIEIRDLEFTLSKENFSDLTEPAVNENRLLLGETEVGEMLDSIAEISVRDYTHAQHSKIEALWSLVNEIREMYHRANREGKEYIETVIGAAVFYLPHPVNECFNGYCSLRALNNTLKDQRMVKEHLFPRKLAGRDVLENKYRKEVFYTRVKDHYRIFMYLTPDENAATVNFEGTHDDVLRKLGIEKFPQRENNPFVKNHTLFKNYISWAKVRVPKNGNLTIEEAERLLNEFLNR